MNANPKNWHKEHREELTLGQKIADGVARVVGSWNFIIIQFSIILAWFAWNSLAPVELRFDPYPFFFVNLAMSFQAAFTAPIIMMSQNRQNERDRAHAEADFETNVEAKQEIEQLIRKLDSIEIDKLDKIIRILEQDKN